MSKKSKDDTQDNVETVSDGWERFQRTMHNILPPRRKANDRGEAADKDQSSDS